MADDKQARIEAVRAQLRQRWLSKPRDPGSRGSGPPNRHGLPKLPPGQHVTDRWPVLDPGRQPRVSLADFRLTVDGAVEEPVTLGWSDLLALPQVERAGDFHCVTSWSKMDLRFKGVQLATLLSLARPLPQATHVMTHADDGYTTNLPLREALEDDVLLAHTVDGAPLPVEHGGPVRIVTPQLYAWKGAKWIRRIEVLTQDRPGFWEERGYSNTAQPWRDDRYS